MSRLGAFTYSSGKAPRGYKCTECSAHGVKLWRIPHMDRPAFCAKCGYERESKLGHAEAPPDWLGRAMWEGRRGDNLGYLIPFVPCENGRDTWGYTSVPRDGIDWWKSLPTWPDESDARIATLESFLADAREANATLLRILDGIAERLTPEESAEVARQMQRAARGGT